MGNCFSAGEQSIPNTRGGTVSENRTELYPDYRSRPSSVPQQPSSNQLKCKVQMHAEDSPSYQRHTSVDGLLNITQEAKALSMYGIKSTFDVLNQRHFQVYVDSAYTLSQDTWNAILLTALYILGNAKAKDANMTFYFTSYPNTKSPSLSERKRGWIKALLNLWQTQSWPQAYHLINSHTILEELGLRSWLVEADLGDSIPDEEKHLKLLNHTRQQMIPLWHGWHQRDLNLEKFERLLITALKASKKQPKSLNSVRITYERAIKHYLRSYQTLKEDSAQEVDPLTVILLVGSGLQPSEVKGIKLCQGEGRALVSEIAKHKHKRFGVRQKPNTDDVEPKAYDGTGTQFQIFTLLFTGHLDDHTIERFKEIDDFAEGDDDINDLLLVDESHMLTRFLSPKALLKLFNPHHPEVDQMALLQPDDIYSRYKLFAGGGLDIVPPTVKQLMKTHGIEDLDDLNGIEDSDDGDDATPRKVRSNVVAPTKGTSTNELAHIRERDLWDSDG